MAKGLDELIEFLLEEIAISGSRGVTIDEIANSTRSFYDELENDLPSADGSSPRPSPAVDRPLLSKIWTWLGRHPEVSIGDDKQYNKSTLAEVENEFPGYVDAQLEGSRHPDDIYSGSDDSQRAPETPKPIGTTRRARLASGPRIRVSTERMYETICGHPPDFTKIAHLEFDLLSHIAAARSNGILQGELRRATGQDKRSVPKRTDALHKKGYIVKETVYRKGNRTSRLIFKKFYHPADGNVELLRDHGGPIRRGSSVRDAVRRIFDVLSDQSLIPQTKLAEELNLDSPAESAVLVKILRRLERLQFLKRVRTAVGPSATSGDLKQFVQLVRHPRVGDLQSFDTEKLSLDQTIQHLASLIEPESHNDSIVGFSNSNNNNNNSLEETDMMRPVAKWNPDRLIPNVMVDAVQLAGRTGLTNWNARQMITGLFVRRTVEALLLRVSGKSLLVQPPHLRHLAIVRTSLVVDGIVQYLHYSWDAFRQMVEEHEIEIGQIPGAKQALKLTPAAEFGANDNTVSVATIETDDLGFPLQTSLPLQLRHGEVDFVDIIRTITPADIQVRSGEPIIVGGGEQGYTMKLRERSTRPIREKTPRQPRQPRLPRQRPIQSDSEEEKIKGRPRKYMRGTEKFWRRQFKQARIDAGRPPAQSSQGTMNDPSGLALYAGRPAEFDETLVAAIDAGLPEPGLPRDINDVWVRLTKTVLNRPSSGVYITSKGVRPENVRLDSQIMIIKTSRLHTVDFYDRRKVQPFRFISSSASHSFAYRRYYPIKQSLFPRTSTSRPKGSSQTPRPRTKVKKKGCPPLGVFHENVAPTRTPFSRERTLLQNVVPIDTWMDTTDEEPELIWLDNQQTGVLRNRSISSGASTTEAPLRRISGKTLPRQVPGDQLNNTTTLPPETSMLATLTPSGRPFRQRKPTQKAGELVASSPGQFSQLFSETSSESDDYPSLESEAQNLSNREYAAEEFEQESEIEEQMIRDRSPEPAKTPAVEHVGETQPSIRIPPMNGKQKVRGDDEAPNVGPVTTKIDDNDAVVTQEEGNEVSQLATVSSPAAVAIQHPERTTPPESDDESDEETVKPLNSAVKKRVSRREKSQRGGRSESRDSEEAQSRQQQNAIRPRHTRGANALCRKIILQLIEETSGVAPNDPYTLKRVSTPRWQEAGEEDRPLLKTIRAAIKTLCGQGKLKSVTFSFRGKSGPILKRSVIFLPQISSLSQLVEDVKQKIIDAEPADYIPLEWKTEGSRIPLVGKKAQGTISSQENPPSPPARRRRKSSVSTVTTPSTRTARSMTREPAPPPPPMPVATGFLTLKVPSLGSLPAVQIYNWRMETPVDALRFDTTPSNPWKPTLAISRRTARRGRRPTTRQPGRSIVWAEAARQNFPSSLNDILQLPELKIKFEDIQSDDPNWQRFACEVEGVRAWEEQESETFLSQRSKYAFINHMVPSALYADSIQSPEIEFAGLVQFDPDGSEIEIPHPPAGSWPVFVTALQTSLERMSQIAGINSEELTQMPPPPKTPSVRRSNRPAKRKATDDDGAFAPLTKRRRGGGARGSGRRQDRRRVFPDKTRTPRNFKRDTRYLRTIPEETLYRIAVSVVVVRTLAGGIESYINWPLVMTLFPDQREDFIKGCWKTLSNKYRPDIKGLTENLQWKYLDALEAGKVASVDFDNLKATDWQGIVEWALKNLDRFNSRQIDGLPAHREEFLDTHNLTFTKPKRLHSILSYNIIVPGPVKDDMVKSIVSGLSHRPVSHETPILQHTPRYELELETADRNFRLAKSWALATVLTPESTFNPTVAFAKLSTLAPTTSTCETLLLRALKLLQDEKMISRAYKDQNTDQLSAVRTWEAARKFWERFEDRRMISAKMLRRAVAYKLEVLDKTFLVGESAIFEKDGIVDDGEMVAVLNLMATGQVKASPGGDVPRTRYGLDSERVGYRTKLMDKGLLGFSVEIAPTAAYEFGDPKLDGRKIPIPRGEVDDDMGLIPPWIDIHGTLQVTLWEMFVVGVLGLVAQMPGITAREVSRALGFAIDVDDVDLLMSWSVSAGFAKMDARSKGYETTEHWWWCISTGAEGGWEWR
ncbi:uncharacterized protein Z518_03063 [Rhinocladiella mackenziei CBS 650.93]|uniref:B-block binding subunit of TFIIIC domain-containing protein n=1 Tax=Rhinocladiella mackenziei CBS 650.93 TaxID=1442369 RepID=A0A0D2G1M1_9EURO|nr:uncharacterized protein Z518_03063 [Rhinocladiella mackenziei CBS 650.93]KIX08407.1 hypothetical protein Z518_03063 [Rhinocladiella mackenziei CBS 650.93]